MGYKSSPDDSKDESSCRFQALISPDRDSWSDLGDMKSVSGKLLEDTSSDTLARGIDGTAKPLDLGGKSTSLGLSCSADSCRLSQGHTLLETGKEP